MGKGAYSAGKGSANWTNDIRRFFGADGGSNVINGVAQATTHERLVHVMQPQNLAIQNAPFAACSGLNSRRKVCLVAP